MLKYLLFCLRSSGRYSWFVQYIGRVFKNLIDPFSKTSKDESGGKAKQVPPPPHPSLVGSLYWEAHNKAWFQDIQLDFQVKPPWMEGGGAGGGAVRGRGREASPVEWIPLSFLHV